MISNKLRTIYLFSSVLFVSTCSNNPITNQNSLPIHGRFCGSYTPDLPLMTEENLVKTLNDIKPIDEIDKACQTHDICYTQNANNEDACDKNLIHSIQAMGKTFDNARCWGLTEAILGYFQTKNPENFNDITDAYIDNIGIATSKAIDTAMKTSATLTAMPLLILSGRDPSEAFELWKDRRKIKPKKENINNLSATIYPSRYEVCD